MAYTREQLLAEAQRRGLTAKPAETPSFMGMTAETPISDMIASNLTFGLSRPVGAFGAGLGSALAGRGFSAGFDRSMGSQKKDLEQTREEYPFVNIASALMSPAPAAGYIAKGATNLGKLGRASLVGAGAIGTQTAAEESDALSDVPADFAKGAALGGLTTAGLGGGLMAGASALNRMPKAKTLQDKAVNFVADKLVQSGRSVDDLTAMAKNQSAVFKKSGVDATIPEVFDNPALTKELTATTRSSGAKSRIDDFLKTRTAQIDTQTNRVLETIDPSMRGQAARSADVVDAANAQKQQIEKQLIEESRPFYQAAEKTFIPAKDPIIYNPYIRKLIGDIRKDPILPASIRKAPPNSLTMLDEVKKRMYALGYNTPVSKDFTKRDQGLVRELANRVRGRLVKASPDYAKALEIYEEGTPQVQQLIESRLGKVMDFGEAEGNQVFTKIFDDAPENVAKNIRTLMQQDPKAAEGAIAGFMQQSLDNIRNDTSASLYKALYARDKTKNALRSALQATGDKTSLKLLDNVMDVMRQNDDTVRLLGGSQTTPLAGLAQGQDAAAQGKIGATRKIIQNVGDYAYGLFSQQRNEKFLDALAETLLDGKKSQQLLGLLQTKGINQRQKAEIIAKYMGITPAAARALNTTEMIDEYNQDSVGD
ncbi:MAG: hypothetical protein EB059_09075 [Alphaproteobacteria bacterium]|nr:hypothetical protein [Alphaproteobacteria bacterium]